MASTISSIIDLIAPANDRERSPDFVQIAVTSLAESLTIKLGTPRRHFNVKGVLSYIDRDSFAPRSLDDFRHIDHKYVQASLIISLLGDHPGIAAKDPKEHSWLKERTEFDLDAPGIDGTIFLPDEAYNQMTDLLRAYSSRDAEAFSIGLRVARSSEDASKLIIEEVRFASAIARVNSDKS